MRLGHNTKGFGDQTDMQAGDGPALRDPQLEVHRTHFWCFQRISRVVVEHFSIERSSF